MRKHSLFAMIGAASLGLALSACVVTPVPDDPANNTGAKTDHRAGTGTGSTGAPPPRTGTDTGTTTNTNTTPDQGGVVRDWRKGRIGSAARFAIEPSMGPVGTVVNVYGVFRPAVAGGPVTCSFNGAEPVNPYFVSLRRIVVRVPDNAKTGAASCSIQSQSLWNGRFVVVPTADDVIAMDEERGVLGVVYRIPQGTSRLPDFATLGDPIGTFVVPTIHVSPRKYERGFPGMDVEGEKVREWYALRYIGLIESKRTADYSFKLKAGDGARLYIDDKLVVDNDGVHGPQDREGVVNLPEGKHRLVVEYFKTSGAQIALELWWKRGNNEYTGVAKNSLSRYSVEYDCSAEPIPVMCCQAQTPMCTMCRERQQAGMNAWRQQCRP